ncbi:Asp23/Gls24 family envelope stress response protein [Leucobacter luti]|uniref:Putative alkaline shock family protein YloU n=1 Tax=Leucobacter luti TaxID=340320 RepID=A0A4R6S4V3_9MICO|nr:Asp23/Gls24 family envelope stress response protein [Leucobacter luti]MCW2287087.1 putative alkaline shock family protein YloU [Leucobacter luti]QYM76815.1 Asp23/Gls24 family envelope stress response protein [Leucobacter luti]TCK41311.1 putative alkaline shock family protein YloU [Leucobacter luti]TDP94294.1 putative alkaline shock family protein YloU [Leucobacter luti]
MANVSSAAPQPKIQTAQTAQPAATDPTALGGKTTIEDGVVAKIAGIAAREVAGVYALGGGAARVVGAIRDVLNTTDLSQGISVEVGEKQVAVDVTIVAEYPAALQQVAGEVRAAIYRAMQHLVGMEVTEVNVTVNDVHIPSDDDDAAVAQTQEARVL